MKKILFGAMMLASMSGFAQDTYTNAEIATEDLNGTARYVGMGGALEALGADISTINSNPAGVGLFRRSMVSVSGGLISQAGAPSSKWADGTNASLDQVGGVWATNMGGGKFLNFGFNYKKNRSFNNITNVAANLNGSSLNNNSFMNLQDIVNLYAENGYTGDPIDDLALSQLDVLMFNTFVGDKDGFLYHNDGTDYQMERATSGYVASYDLNISGNVSNRWYMGLTVGINDVNYRSWSAYSENLLNSKDQGIGSITVNDYREITGSGYNLKFGTIFFPIEDNPFRIGFSVETPTYYDLTTHNHTTLTNNANTGGNPPRPNYFAEENYDYAIHTPWKFGASVGHTISNYIALGASYQYADYGYTRSRIIDGYDYYGESYSSNDVKMNTHTEATLKGVSTLKLGMEVKPTAEWAVRLGYNYVTPMYRQEAFRDGTIESCGTYYSSRADYTNWKATNRLTCGVGYAFKNFNFDLAYQYSNTSGEFHPFMDSYADYVWDDGYTESIDNYADAVNVSNSRHQLIGTVTFKF